HELGVAAARQERQRRGFDGAQQWQQGVRENRVRYACLDRISAPDGDDDVALCRRFEQRAREPRLTNAAFSSNDDRASPPRLSALQRRRELGELRATSAEC